MPTAFVVREQVPSFRFEFLVRHLCFEPRLDLPRRTEANDLQVRMAVERTRPHSPVFEVLLDGEGDERVAREEREPPRLPVSLEEIVLGDDVLDGASDQAPKDERHRLVQPDERVRPAENEIAKLALIQAVEHPAVNSAHRRLEVPSEVLITRLTPSRLMVEGIE